MPGVLVVGSVNVDLVVRGQRLPQPGETVLEGEFFQAAGGKGANQAAAAARAAGPRADGNRVQLVAAVGNDPFGDYSRQSLESAGVDLCQLQVIPDAPTGIAVILVDEQGQNLISVASGANAQLMPTTITRIPAEEWTADRVLITNLESPLETVLTALKLARRAGMTTILNPAPANPAIRTRDWARHIDILTPNQSEAELLTGQPVHSHADAALAVRKLQALGFERIALTLGGDGVCLCEREITFLPAIKVTAVDATAAGDCFTGVLGEGISRGLPFVDAARRAVAAAGICVTRGGAQPSLPVAEEIAQALAAGAWPVA